MIDRNTPLLISDARSQPELTASGELRPIQSYLGVPLIVGAEMVGTLEAGQTGGNGFGSHELDLLKFVSGQAAVALRNAKLYEDEQRRAAELAGLAKLNQSLGAIRDTNDLFNRLVNSIAPLFAMEIIGFLLFDEERRTLEGKIPFRGLPSNIVDIYRATISAGSHAEQLIQEQKPIITLNAALDETWRVLGLTEIGRAHV